MRMPSPAPPLHASARTSLPAVHSGGTPRSDSPSPPAPDVPFPRTSFPPPISEAEALLAEDGVMASAQVASLRGWRDALLGLLEDMDRGPPAEGPPLDDVWHWFAANERLTRSLAFAEHSTLSAFAVHVAGHGGPEGAEVAERWREVVLRLRLQQKESLWNVKYMRIVQNPLTQLCADDAVLSGSLAGTVGRLLRSLQRIFCTSSFFREHRMTLLLHKILKVIVKNAGIHITSPLAVSSPPGGYRASLQAAEQLRDAFKAFSDHYFISDMESKSSSRPATAPVPGGFGTRRKDASDLGWWRATMRTSLDQAEHGSSLCSRVATLLSRHAILCASLPGIRAADPELMREAEAFMELHSGVRSLMDTSEMLDPKHRVEAMTAVNEVEERLLLLLAKVNERRLLVTDAAYGDEDDVAGVGVAEILTLPHVADGEAQHILRPATSPSVQESIDSMREELRQFDSKLAGMSKMIRQNATQSCLPFSPPARLVGVEANEQSAQTNAADHQDSIAALEVAKRSSWYKEPPQVLPSDVPLIQVSSSVKMRAINRVPSRPRTSQPSMLSRPQTAPAASQSSMLAHPRTIPAASLPSQVEHPDEVELPHEDESGEHQVRSDAEVDVDTSYLTVAAARHVGGDGGGGGAGMAGGAAEHDGASSDGDVQDPMNAFNMTWRVT